MYTNSITLAIMLNRFFPAKRIFTEESSRDPEESLKKSLHSGETDAYANSATSAGGESAAPPSAEGGVSPKFYETKFGGAEGDRTPDLMHAMHALSQLSYSPVFFV